MSTANKGTVRPAVKGETGRQTALFFAIEVIALTLLVMVFG
jgi:hypothetical protein